MKSAHPFKLASLIASLALGLSACGGGEAQSVPPVQPPPPAPAHFSLGGQVTTPADITRDDLLKLTPATQTVQYLAGAAAQTHIYTGTSLWSLLNGAGIQTNSAVKNDILNKYVLATGSDGYKVVFSMGEINPDFGNRASLVAYAETTGGVSAPFTDADGFAKVTAPGDVKGGRYVSGLARLDVRASGSTVPTAGGGVSTSFTVSGAVLHPGTFDITALKALPAVTETAGGATYTGVSLWSLLNTTAGIKSNPAVKNDTLGMYVVATGSDGYKALIAVGEIDPSFGAANDLVAYSSGGVDLTTNGFARLVVPGDTKAGRYVSNLVSLEVFAAPAAQ